MTLVALNDALNRLPGRISGVYSVPLTSSEPFLDTVARFAAQPGTVALLSGGSFDCARYHILGVTPWLTVRASASTVSIERRSGSGDQELRVRADPLSVVQRILERYTLSPEQPLPLSSGLLGYLSYDLKDCLEELPRTAVDDQGLPHLYLAAPSALLIEDRVEQRLSAHLPTFEGEGENVVIERFLEFERTLSLPRPGWSSSLSAGKLRSGFSRSQYLEAVGAIKDYIARGHVYQVNMSQRFQARFEGDAFALFERLYARNPAPFFAYVNAGDHQIVSTSPERFLKQSGKLVETRPIKGTRPRGKTPEEDQRMREELESSKKDDAELSMIVDLMRNDLGKVCRAGSVRVSEHKRLEGYQNVHHLVSIVHGELDEGQDSVELIRATFPGGSITGCPKIRAMEVIDELEPVRRHIYTGSIGYLSFHQTMDLSIAIRTATLSRGQLVFSVGGGVVYDSDPGSEYEETLHKGRTLMTAFDPVEPRGGSAPRIAWCNGFYRPVEELAVPVEDEGFAYGYGLFETLRVERGIPGMLEAHLGRFHRAWEACFGTPPPDLSWREIILQVVAKSQLLEKTAAVKILAAAGRPGSRAFNGTLLVTAREYVPRLAGTGRTGLRLRVYPHRRHSPLCEYKTTNYMLNKMAGVWARQQRGDEAILLDPDGSVSETNTANLFYVSKGQIYRPLSAHALRGTMESAVCRLLSSWGMSVESRRATVTELERADRVFLTNSLMGAAPVTCVDDTPLPEDDGLCRRINEAVL